MNITNNIQNLYAEKYKTLMKEIKDLSKYRNILSVAQKI